MRPNLPVTHAHRFAEAAAAAERAAVNTVPQGSAADVCKLAMIDIHRRGARELPRDSCRLLIQVRQRRVMASTVSCSTAAMKSV